MQVGREFQFDVDVELCSTCRLTWSSSNPAVAAVDSTGKAKGIAEGAVNITASVAGDRQDGKASARLTVVR